MQIVGSLLINRAVPSHDGRVSSPLQTDLVNLFLWNSPNGTISDEGLASLSSLPLLETFRLEASTAVTDVGWVDFTAAHSAITRLDLVKCPNISGEGRCR